MRTVVLGWVAFGLAGCISEPAQELGVSELQPAWCEDDAQAAQDDCLAACEALPDPVEDCLGPANDDLALYFDEVVAAFEAVDPSVTGDVSACIDSFDGLEDDCALLHDKIEEGMSAYGPVIAEFQATWSAIPCEGIASLMRAARWKEVSCIVQYKDELVTEAGDTGWLLLTLDRGPWELADWAWRAGSCGVTNWVKDAAYWSCVNVGCEGARALGYAQCRRACPAPEGTACVPAGYPGWADCGVWQMRPALDNVGLGTCDCVADPAPLNPFDNGLCGRYDAEARRPFGTFNRGCDVRYPHRFMNGSTGLWTFVVEHDEWGNGISYDIGCFGNDDLRVLELRDSCSFAYDGVCEEEGLCELGTDTTDCRFGQP
jgi:hypothetical protein